MLVHAIAQPDLERACETGQDQILIVDGNAEMIQTLATRLAHQGFKVLTAANGAEGRVIAHRDGPDAIIMDLGLPDANGLTVCQELADSPDTCGIPVILLSGMARPDIVRRSRAAGCQYFIRKPYDPNVLLTLIRQSIDESRRWRRGPMA